MQAAKQQIIDYQTPPSCHLSAVIVAHNEERNLDECLKRLSFCDEIIVVLDRTNDRSEEIARRYTDKIYHGAWPIEGARRNYALSLCGGAWIFEIDADERVDQKLADEIINVTRNADADYYMIPVDNYIGSNLVRYGWGAYFGVSAVLRLHRRGHKRWGMQHVHPAIFTSGRKGRMFENRLVHYVDENISDLWARLDRYTTARAKDLRRENIQETLGRNIRRFFSRFYKCYVRRHGYREGAYGFLIALCAGLYPLLSHLKARLEKDS